MKTLMIILAIVAAATIILAAVLVYKHGKYLNYMSRCGCRKKRAQIKVSHISHFKSANMVAGEIVLAYPLYNY